MKILITGGSGFVASHLVDWILDDKPFNGDDIYVLVRQQSNDYQLERLGKNADRVNIVFGDLNYYTSIAEVIDKIRPEKIFHLAAHSFVRTSFDDPTAMLSNNIFAELNLLEAIRATGLQPVVHIAGSSEQYGLVKSDELPIKETNPLRPLSPYGVSKIAQESLAYQYYKSYGIPTILTRAFNHEGPRRGRQFFLSNMCYQIASIEKGMQQPVIKVGDLSAKRDITHVKDMVAAYWLATEHCEPGEVYNIGKGVSYSMKELLDMILAKSHVEVDIQVDENRLRPSEVTQLLCDANKFKKATGWSPEYTIEDVILDTLNYWRTKLSEFN